MSMAGIQLLWTNRPPNLGVPGPNLTSAKLNEQCYFPQGSYIALLFGTTPSGDILYLRIQVLSFRPPGNAQHLAAVSSMRAVCSLSTLCPLVYLLSVTEMSPLQQVEEVACHSGTSSGSLPSGFPKVGSAMHLEEEAASPPAPSSAQVRYSLAHSF